LYFLTPRSELSRNITAPALFRYIEECKAEASRRADSFVKGKDPELRQHQSYRPGVGNKAPPVLDLGTEGTRHHPRRGRGRCQLSY
jgi:hypothetical protein